MPSAPSGIFIRLIHPFRPNSPVVFKKIYKVSSRTRCFALILVKILVRKVPENPKVPGFSKIFRRKEQNYGLYFSKRSIRFVEYYGPNDSQTLPKRQNPRFGTEKRNMVCTGRCQKASQIEARNGPFTQVREAAAAPTNQEDLPRSLRLHTGQLLLQLQPSGQQPAPAHTGGGSLQERQGFHGL